MIALLLLLLAFLAPTQPTLILSSPAPYQVFQRDPLTNRGAILVSGTVTSTDTTVTISWDTATITAPISNASFRALLYGSTGQHSLTVSTGGQSITIPYVSIGDLYVIAGQSNASGRGINNQHYRVTNGLKASLYGNDLRWHELIDPTDSGLNEFDTVSNDTDHVGGSVWPLLATYILNTGVPVGFIPAAAGGSSIAQWQPTSFGLHTLYGALDYRLRTLQLPTLPTPTLTGIKGIPERSFIPGIRAVLWMQGEADALHEVTAQAYAQGLERLADSLYRRYQVTFLPATLAHAPYTSAAHIQAINAGIGLAVTEREYIFAGADLSTLTVDTAISTFHFRYDSSLQIVAARWWQALRSAGFY